MERDTGKKKKKRGRGQKQWGGHDAEKYYYCGTLVFKC